MASIGHTLATGSGCGPDGPGASTNPLATLADAVLARGRGKASATAHDVATAAHPPPPPGADLAAAWEADRGLARARAWARACHPGADAATLERHAAALAAGPGPGAAAAAVAAAAAAAVGGAALPDTRHARHQVWADEYAAAPPPPPPPPPPAAWAAEFARHHHQGHPWAAEYARHNHPASWADEFVSGSATSTTSTSSHHHHHDPTPAERKAARGPSADDPVDDPAAPTWVAQFNGSLGGRTVNTEGGGMESLVVVAGLVPADENPMTRVADPAAAASAASRAGRWAEVALAWEAAVRRAPADPSAWAALGHARRVLGDAAGAVKALRLAVDASASTALLPSTLLSLASAAVEAGGAKDREVGTAALARWAEVVVGVGAGRAPLDATLESAARLRGADARTALGTLRLLRNQPLPAADAFAAAAAANPSDAAALTSLGRALHLAARPDHADRALAAAVRADPGHAPAWLALGDVRAATGASEAGAAAYAHAARLLPDCGRAWDGVALAGATAGRPDWVAAAEARGDLRAVGL